MLVPLSGGIDSCSTAVIVFGLCRMLLEACKQGNERVMKDVRRIAGAYEKKDWLPKTPQEICFGLFHTLFMGMEAQSSPETRERAKALSKAIGSYHIDVRHISLLRSHQYKWSNVLQTSSVQSTKFIMQRRIILQMSQGLIHGSPRTEDRQQRI